MRKMATIIRKKLRYPYGCETGELCKDEVAYIVRIGKRETYGCKDCIFGIVGEIDE